jgi:hypothetical protein
MAQPSWIGGAVNGIVERHLDVGKAPVTTVEVVEIIRRERNIDFPGIDQVVDFYVRKAMSARDRERKSVKSILAKINSYKRATEFPSRQIGR